MRLMQIFVYALLFLSCTVTSALACAPPDSFAIKGAVIDRVVAMVEDRAILKSDVDAELARILFQAKRTEISPEEEKAARDEILRGLVSEALLVTQAERENIAVDDREVDERIEQIIEENIRALGGERAFERQLQAEGLTLEALKGIYREKVRTRLLIERLYQKIGSGVRVPEREVRDYYNEHADELPKRPATVNLAHILIVPKPSSEVLDRALKKIQSVEKRLAKGEDFSALAKEMSDCPSAKFGGSLGTIRLEDLDNPAFEDAARKLAPGQISGPVLTEFGYHLIKVEAVEGEMTTLRHILVRTEPTSEDLEAASRIAGQVRAELEAGADFAQLVAKYSDDVSTRHAGGVIGEVQLDNLPQNVRELISGLPPGAITPVFKDEKGFRILKILSWNESRAYTYDEAKEELRRFLTEQKAQQKLDGYVEELKKIYSVRILGGA